jgi:riboflavin kinase/FMN adenylyltransferase
MKRIYDGEEIPDCLRGAVLALGNFDGFHRGHQAVVAQARTLAEREGRPLIVATFDPHPNRFFRPDMAAFLLTTLDQRERLFRGAGADAMLVLSFNSVMASMTCEAFAMNVLRDAVDASAVVTGAGFRFGKGRAGGVRELGRLGRRYGFETQTVDPILFDSERISSTRIRHLLRAGRCDVAATMLTKPFAIQGRVERNRTSGEAQSCFVAAPGYLPLRAGRYRAALRSVGSLVCENSLVAELDVTEEGLRLDTGYPGSRPRPGMHQADVEVGLIEYIA